MKTSGLTGAASSIALTGAVGLLVLRWILFARRPRPSTSADIVPGAETS